MRLVSFYRYYGVLILGFVFILTLDAQSLSLSGSGVKQDPFLINSIDDLILFRNNINSKNDSIRNLYYNKTYLLTVDLILDGNVDWIPIGNNLERSFYGVFDGNGNEISNIIIGDKNNKSSLSNVGFFGFLGSTAKVQNLSVKWKGIYVGVQAYIGGIASVNSGLIENCIVEGVIRNSIIDGVNTITSLSGGIVASNNGIIRKCENLSDISISNASYKSLAMIGGISAKNAGSIINCTNYGNFIASTYSNTESVNSFVGGIVGSNVGNIVLNCSNRGNITSNASSDKAASSAAGGIAGWNSKKILNCFSISSIKGFSNTIGVAYAHIGGIVGYNIGGEISNSYSKNVIESTILTETLPSAALAGGIVGYNKEGEVSHCVVLKETSIKAFGKLAYANRIGKEGTQNVVFQDNIILDTLVVLKGATNNEAVSISFNSDTENGALHPELDVLLFLNSWVDLYADSVIVDLMFWQLLENTNNGCPVFIKDLVETNNQEIYEDEFFNDQIFSLKPSHSVLVYNSKGQLVGKFNGSFEINMLHVFGNGFYFLVFLDDENKLIHTRKLLLGYLP